MVSLLKSPYMPEKTTKKVRVFSLISKSHCQPKGLKKVFSGIKGGLCCKANPGNNYELATLRLRTSTFTMIPLGLRTPLTAQGAASRTYPLQVCLVTKIVLLSSQAMKNTTPSRMAG